MARIDEILSEQFYAWEKRGRGWTVWPHPVSPEPPFRPFYGHYLPEAEVIDDARKPTIFSSLVKSLSRSLATTPPPSPALPEPEIEPEPMILERSGLVELRLSLPSKLSPKPQEFAPLLTQFAFCKQPISFEIVGTSESIVLQLAAHTDDAQTVRRQLNAYFPEVIITQTENRLGQLWEAREGNEIAVVEFGLAREFMSPLATNGNDSCIGLISALAELSGTELGLFQVTFQSVENPWAENVLRAVTGCQEKPFFVNEPDLAAQAEEKVSAPLFATVVRIAARAEQFERAWSIARDLACPLRLRARMDGNELIPLSNEEYLYAMHCADVPSRQCRRNGMLLNSLELVGFVHFPSPEIRVSKLRRESGKTKAAPEIVRQASGVLLGNNVHAGKSIPVKLSPEQRVRHMHIIGASGTGKSTLLYNLIRQDIENGEGIAVLDPHGDLVDRILGIIPPERIAEVIVIDPADESYSVGFNILSAHSDLEKNLLASDLVSVFERLSTSWGDQMASVLRNAILAFLESKQGGTLADLRRFLLDADYRREFLKTVADPDVVYYWQKGFPQLSGNRSIGPVLTRLDTFLSPKPIRYMVSQRENRLDFARIMDRGQIFLAKLSQGQIGKENAFLLGSLLVSKFQQLAMGRQRLSQGERRDFWMFLDECHHFLTPSMAEILIGARKYRVGLILAHQELHQLERSSDVASAVLANPSTRVVFRVGEADARALAGGFSSFGASDLQNLDIGEAIARVERSDWDFNLTIPLLPEPDESSAACRREEVVAASRARYAIPREQIESPLHQTGDNSPPPKSEPKPKMVAAELRISPQLDRPAPPLPVPEPQPEQEPSPITAPQVGSEGRPAKTPINQDPPLVRLIPPPPIAEPPQASKPPAKLTPSPSDMGRGGAQHQAIQRRLKDAAQACGFRATVEKPVFNGEGSVDLLLERPDQTIACEISITTTIDHEVKNVAKCIKAGFAHVAVICIDDERLRKIGQAVAGSLGPEAGARVTYQQPDQFITWLQTLILSGPKAAEAPKTRRGYTVKRSIPQLSPDEQKQREEAAIWSIAEAMRRLV